MEALILAFGLLTDYFTKRWAADHLSDGTVIHLIKGYFDFEYVENRGAAFGIFQGRVLPLTLVSVIILIFLAYYYMKTGKKDRLTSVSLILIIGGALGNIIDRISLGYVVDFIHLHINNIYHFPTFNIADVMVVAGVILMLIKVIFFEDKKIGAGN